MHLKCLAATLLCTLLFSQLTTAKDDDYNLITCGSVFKLSNSVNDFRLHSHDVKYGSGSGQQSVTGTPTREDVNSYWAVKGTPDRLCSRGEPIKCGTSIRLEHLQTKKNLHSHFFKSPISGNQEVSAFGKDGEGDSGDIWTVVCSGQYWERDAKIRFKHADTELYAVFIFIFFKFTNKSDNEMNRHLKSRNV
jgi:dolichyl-phosphate-mannose--protein O-mannosyl transferase